MTEQAPIPEQDAADPKAEDKQRPDSTRGPDAAAKPADGQVIAEKGDELGGPA